MNTSYDFPKKSSYTFDELVTITTVKPYVLRYWETEFPQVQPLTNQEGVKVYSLADLYTILKIKELLFVDKMPILEAKNEINKEWDSSLQSQADDACEQLKPLKDDQRILLALESLRKANSLISNIKQTW